jgi:SAM-dependent methyltransferase
MKFCICGNEFTVYDDDSYNKCPECGCYIYLCSSLSSELNKEFYDNLYTNNQIYRVNKVKKNIFYFFKSIDKMIRKSDYQEFDVMHLSVFNLLNDKTKKILEVGFGTGCNLGSLLESGSDAYGIDISQANVDRFINKYPKFSDRVTCSTRLDSPVDVIYSSALFEHLDNPQEFLDNVSSVITEGGYIILDNIPVANNAVSNIPIPSDINFWEGIHKAIYSKKATIELFKKNGYELYSYGDFDYFIYRVLSAHKYYGHNVIENIRLPYMSGDKLPGILRYMKLCNRAVTMKSQALLGFAIFRKTSKKG